MNQVIVRIGRDEHGDDLELDLAEPYHWAIQGTTRSGKSNLVYCLLHEVLAFDNVVIAGCDPTGIIFGPMQALPGSELRAFGAREIRQSETVMVRLVDEMDARIERLLAQGRDKFEDFDSTSPLVVILMEEYSGLLAAAESLDVADGSRGAQRIAPALARMTQRLVQESAKVGFRVILLTQRAEASALGSALRANLSIRLSLRADNADAVRLLHPDAEPQAVARLLHASPGQGLIDRPGNKSTQFRADRLDYREFAKLPPHLWTTNVLDSRDNLEGDTASER